MTVSATRRPSRSVERRREQSSGIGAWCGQTGVDAWYRQAPQLDVATTPAQVGAWRDFVAACREVDAPENGVELTADEVRARCDSPTFLGGALRPKAATVHPARLSLGLRKEVLRRGVRLHEHTRVTKIARDGVATAPGGTVRAKGLVLAVNTATAGFPGYRLALAVASSHMVITEPVPDVIDELGWTGGEAINDCRTLLRLLPYDA